MNARSAVQVLGAVTAATGAATVLGSSRAATLSAGRGSRPDPRIVRVLGARQVMQGVVQVALPGRFSVDAGIFADISHAASMIALAGGSARFRRPATISAAIAVASAIGGLVVRPQRSGQ